MGVSGTAMRAFMAAGAAATTKNMFRHTDNRAEADYISNLIAGEFLRKVC